MPLSGSSAYRLRPAEESIAGMHHGQVVKEKEIAGLKIKGDGSGLAKVVQGVKGQGLRVREGWEARWTWARRCACDTSPGTGYDWFPAFREEEEGTSFTLRATCGGRDHRPGLLEDGQEVGTTNAHLFNDIRGACKVEATPLAARNEGVKRDNLADIIVEGHGFRPVRRAMVNVARVVHNGSWEGRNVVDDVLVASFAACHATFGAHMAADAGLDDHVLFTGVFVGIEARD